MNPCDHAVGNLGCTHYDEDSSQGPGYVPRFVTIDAHDPNALEAVIRAEGFEQEILERLEGTSPAMEMIIELLQERNRT